MNVQPWNKLLSLPLILVGCSIKILGHQGIYHRMNWLRGATLILVWYFPHQFYIQIGTVNVKKVLQSLKRYLPFRFSVLVITYKLRDHWLFLTEEKFSQSISNQSINLHFYISKNLVIRNNYVPLKWESDDG
jgi:hypothetical protein